ncbi:MAG TPA: YeeE/YedE thiosulfate transporter family protein [Symbiobacteriaceae bacterium]|jgi:hypothetical protein
MLTALITLTVGLAAGYLAQRSRICFIAGVRDWLLVRDTELLAAVAGFIGAAYLAFPILGALGLPVWGNGDPTLAAGAGTPLVAVLAGALVGGLATASGGCPLRQHVLAAQGGGDSWFWLAGFYLGVPLYYVLVWPLLAPMLPH